MRIRVAMRDKVGASFVVRETKILEIALDKDLERIANRAESVIRYTIENKTEGGTGKLANSDAWTPEKIIDGWGVGDISQLDKEVPYWNHQDKGSQAIGANWQHYLPQGFWSNGRWVKSDKGFYGIQPQSPIEALNYIAETLQKMEIEIPRILKG